MGEQGLGEDTAVSAASVRRDVGTSGRLLRRLGRGFAAQFRRPAVVVALGFAGMILVLTALLMLPVAHEAGQGTSFREALFTATSAVCVTGLIVVDTPTHWSTFGEVVIVSGIQVGGFGFMTSASLLGVLVARRLGLRTRVLAAAETRSLGLGDVRRVIRGVVLISLTVEAAVAVLLALRFWLGHGMVAGRAAYHGVFHAVSAFNNAGFALYTDNLIGYATDPLVCLPIAAAVVLGGIGFPVILELRRELRTPRRWSLHTKTTLLGTALLLAGGTGLVTAFEWRNPGTLGPLGAAEKLLVGFFQGGVQPRTAGFNSLDYAQVHETSLLVTDALMFIGGGSAGTAGGIKVTTFMLLLFAILAEVRGDPTVDAFGRQVPAAVLRQALSVALLGVALVAVGTLALLGVSGLDLDRVLFEAVSAFATVGLSTGITAQLPPAGQYILVGLMFVGRIGPITFASALALRQSRKLFRHPEERAIVG
jgi:trk system potassium uptake protein